MSAILVEAMMWYGYTLINKLVIEFLYLIANQRIRWTKFLLYIQHTQEWSKWQNNSLEEIFYILVKVVLILFPKSPFGYKSNWFRNNSLGSTGLQIITLITDDRDYIYASVAKILILQISLPLYLLCTTIIPTINIMSMRFVFDPVGNEASMIIRIDSDRHDIYHVT